MYLASAYPNSALSAGAMIAIVLVMAGSLALWLVTVFLADRDGDRHGDRAATSATPAATAAPAATAPEATAATAAHATEDKHIQAA